MRSTLLVLALLLANIARADSVLKLVTTIEMSGVEGRFDHFAADLNHDRLYVAALGNNSVEVIDIAANERLPSIKDIPAPAGIAYTANNDRIIVGCSGDGACRIFDSTQKLISTIKDLDDADNVRIDAKSGVAYVGYGSGAIAALGESISHIKLPAHPESFQLEGNGNRIFVNVPEAHQVAVIDREKRKVIANWKIDQAEANFPMALDEDHNRLFIACRKPAKLLVLDTQTGKTTTAIDCVGDADDVFYDTKKSRIYISGGGGAISVIEPKDADHYSPLERIATAAGARTSLFIPQTRTLYLAVPHRGEQHAEIRVYKTVD